MSDNRAGNALYDEGASAAIATGCRLTLVRYKARQSKRRASVNCNVFWASGVQHVGKVSATTESIQQVAKRGVKPDPSRIPDRIQILPNMIAWTESGSAQTRGNSGAIVGHMSSPKMCPPSINKSFDSRWKQHVDE